ncbi:MAG: LysE family translocator [Ectothiorhodospiraceae bacterium]|nr:LysE family translocator [Ectothiorhodospiraceae bacterium]MCH8505213.1 LysE family translocator [Ectothiorhodospiraceae bacterium]
MIDYIVFLGICVVATISPGPAVFLAIKNSLQSGTKKALVGVYGNVLAMLTLASISAAGLGAVILASSTLYTAIKIIGGVYLIYLGLKIFCSASRPINEGEETYANVSPKKSILFREAYFIGVSNPKAIAFYTALFPQFINLHEPVFPQFVLLSVTFAICSFAALMAYVFVAGKLKIYLQKENVSLWFNRITGGVFLGFGVAILSNNKA